MAKRKPADSQAPDPTEPEVAKEDQMDQQEPVVIAPEIVVPPVVDQQAERLTQAEAKAAAAEAQAKKAQEIADRALATIRESFRSRELSGAVHADVLSLAPQLELDDACQPTAQSLEALRAWKADRASLFAAPPAASAPVVAPGVTTPAPTSSAVQEITQEEIDRVFREDKPLYMTKAFQARATAFWLRQRGRK